MLSHKRSGLTRGKTVLVIIGAAFVFLAGVWAVEWLSFAKLLKEGAVDTLDSLSFDNKFSAEKNTAPKSGNSADVSSIDNPAVGSDKAGIVAVEFVDFSCPYSKEEYSIVRELVAANSDLVRLEVRDFPLDDMHPDARRAAMAAACVGEQGKYWAMHDSLFANQASDGAWAENDLRRLALGTGIDAKKYDACMKTGKYADAIQADVAVGIAAGVTGTPTFFVNGYKIDGAIPADVWQRIINLIK